MRHVLCVTNGEPGRRSARTKEECLERRDASAQNDIPAGPGHGGEWGSQMATKSLYVGNIPHGTSEQELRDLFDEYGPLGDVRVIEGKGFAFVDVPEENAANAIAAMNEKDLNGRALRVDEAKPRRERSEGGRGFGGGGGGGGRRGGGGGGGDRRW